MSLFWTKNKLIEHFRFECFFRTIIFEFLFFFVLKTSGRWEKIDIALWFVVWMNSYPVFKIFWITFTMFVFVSTLILICCFDVLFPSKFICFSTCEKEIFFWAYDKPAITQYPRAIWHIFLVSFIFIVISLAQRARKIKSKSKRSSKNIRHIALGTVW